MRDAIAKARERGGKAREATEKDREARRRADKGGMAFEVLEGTHEIQGI